MIVHSPVNSDLSEPTLNKLKWLKVQHKYNHDIFIIIHMHIFAHKLLSLRTISEINNFCPIDRAANTNIWTHDIEQTNTETTVTRITFN